MVCILHFCSSTHKRGKLLELSIIQKPLLILTNTWGKAETANVRVCIFRDFLQRSVITCLSSSMLEITCESSRVAKVLVEVTLWCPLAARFGTAGTYSDKNGKVPNSVKYGGRAIVKNGPCYQVRLPSLSVSFPICLYICIGCCCCICIGWIPWRKEYIYAILCNMSRV